jgi:hypothetical protein
MKIFIGGSRAMTKLTRTIRDRLDEFIQRGDSILIGDANGADRAVQGYFAERHYGNVEVFCAEECRNNIGSWLVRSIVPPHNRKDFSYYAAKDLVMSREAGCGVMLWDGKSTGTLHNILNLMAAGKRTLVYFGPVKQFQVLANDQDVKMLLARCHRKTIEAAVRALGLTPPLPLVHSSQLYSHVGYRSRTAPTFFPTA